ncbi:unnamed protein product, partial [Vitis vinifera]|uniref:Uncharacterized protein n=1 Tax=Vitis vinifera TaxID=29760 RepID=D7T628_VITVI
MQTKEQTFGPSSREGGSMAKVTTSQFFIPTATPATNTPK